MSGVEATVGCQDAAGRPATPTVAAEAVTLGCDVCSHTWDGARLPMALSVLVGVMAHARCPACGETQRLRAGPAPGRTAMPNAEMLRAMRDCLQLVGVVGSLIDALRPVAQLNPIVADNLDAAERLFTTTFLRGGHPAADAGAGRD